jgi:hypothetical protein
VRTPERERYLADARIRADPGVPCQSRLVSLLRGHPDVAAPFTCHSWPATVAVMDSTKILSATLSQEFQTLTVIESSPVLFGEIPGPFDYKRGQTRR